MKYEHKINTETIKGIPIMIIEGDLTSDADRDTKDVYSKLKEKHSTEKLIVNFEKTNYINSSGIATLICIIQEVNDRNGTIAFIGMSDHLKKVMNIVGISDFVQTYNTNDEAIESM